MYVKRDDNGRVTAVSETPAEGMVPAGADDPQVTAFLQRAMDHEQAQFQASDIEFVRVLEDLLEVLMDKGVIRFTDLPEPAQNKLMNRKSMRDSAQRLQLMNDDDEII